MNIRNVAIIAHVDHGKTTLVDQILRQCNVFRQGQEVRERFMDSNDLERERGITITSKNFAVTHGDVRINLIDTPGHSDFGGEVERVLQMADGVLLLVDAFEGPMPQTRFVLQKALELHLKPVVLINKVDRDQARPADVLDELLSLFIDLDADEDQLDFPYVYASGRDGWAVTKLTDAHENLRPLLEMIVEHIPPPEMKTGPLQMLVTAMDHSDYVGRIGIGRVVRGELRAEDAVALLKRDGSQQKATVQQLFVFDDLGRREVDAVGCGDICAVVGVTGVDIGDTIADIDQPEMLPLISVDEPTLTMAFMPNDSPYYGQDGKYVSSRQLRERLFKEVKRDVALRVEETASTDTFKVSGRGILHISILMENMRREGYEFMVGQPQVIFKEIAGKKAEPIEMLTVDVPNQHTGAVIEYAGQRHGELQPRAHRIPQQDDAGHLRGDRRQSPLPAVRVLQGCHTAASERQHYLDGKRQRGHLRARRSAGSRTLLHRTGREALRGADHRRALQGRRLGRQRAEGEETHQHAIGQRRPQDEDRSGGQDEPRGSARVSESR
jgi:GTP-binding protein